MRPSGRLLAICVWVPAALLLVSCESSVHKAEVITGNNHGKVVIRVASSDEAIVAFQRLAERYASRSGVRFEISQTQSSNILDLLAKGTVDLGVSARKLTDEGRRLEVSYVPFAYDGVVFIASSEANVRSVRSDQIRRMFEGKITNWKEVGGADRKINLITRPPYSSVSIAIGTSVFRGEYPKPKSAFTLETSEGAFQALKSLDSYLAVVPLSRMITDHFPAVPLTVDGMEPLLSHVPFEKYPAKLEYGVSFMKDSPEPVKEFVTYLISIEAIHQLASIGLAPARQNLSLSSCHCRETEGTFVPTRKSDLAGNLTIAVVPELGAIQQEKRYAGICQVIAEGLGVKTQLKHMESYGRVIDEFSEGKIDAAFVGSLVYGHLHNRLGVVPLARPEKTGVSFYRGWVIVRKDGGIRHFSDLRGRSFAYVPSTSAGELFTLSLVGKDTGGGAKYFSRIVTTSSHSDVVHLVDSGKVAGGAVKDLVLNRMIGENPGLKDRLLIIRESASFPENALVVSPMMNESQKQRLRNILISCDQKDHGRKALSVMGADRFIPTVDGEYSNMYALAKSVDYKLGR